MILYLKVEWKSLMHGNFEAFKSNEVYQTCGKLFCNEMKHSNHDSIKNNHG